jgi:glutamate synthase (NADPH/NADH) large chain
VVNFLRFIAREMRELMALLGFRTVDEMVGRADRLQVREAIEHWKARGLDFSELLYRPDLEDEEPQPKTQQDHGLDDTLDNRLLLGLCRPALEQGQPVSADLPIRNVDRVVGTMVGSEITRRYGADGLPEDTIRLHFTGSAGLSFGAFVPRGMTLLLEGDSNDYLGKGLSGGKIVSYPHAGSTFVAEDSVITGNVALYGGTSGEAYLRGKAGERFCVRNSGVAAVVEGVGDHGCEYMTGGRVVVLGPTGRNFAAGMSGGTAYVFDERGDFDQHCNREMVTLRKLTDPAETAAVKEMIQRHAAFTGSAPAIRVLAAWEDALPRFVRVVPNDYERMMEAFREVEAEGLSGDEAAMAAFELNKNDRSRVSGN